MIILLPIFWLLGFECIYYILFFFLFFFFDKWPMLYGLNLDLQKCHAFLLRLFFCMSVRQYVLQFSCLETRIESTVFSVSL